MYFLDFNTCKDITETESENDSEYEFKLEDCDTGKFTSGLLKKSLSCHYCNRRFNTTQHLKRHEKIHIEKPFFCEKCDNRFTNESSLKLHQKFRHRYKPYLCRSCDKTFHTMQHLKRHNMVHTGEKPYSCSYCQKKFALKQTLQTHKMIHTDEKPYSCKYCHVKFNHISHVIRHENRNSCFWKYRKSCIKVDTPAMRPAEKTESQFTETNNIIDSNNLITNKVQVGEQNTSGPKSNKRKVKKSFSKIQILKKHKLIYAGKRSYSCQYCTQLFRHRYSLKRHEQMHKEKPFECQKCNNRFTNESSLTLHHKFRHTHKPHSCTICDKRFDQMANLKRHYLVHTGEKPYSCKFCPQKFSHDHVLKRHEKIHTGEKPYSCKSCNKSFRQLETLRRHQKTHTGEKPHSCKYCGINFGLLSSLKRHNMSKHESEETLTSQTITLHMDEPSLKTSKLAHEYLLSCQYCDKIFKTKSHLRSHLLVHTQEKTYSCQFCPKKFNHGHVLKRHQKKIHKMTSNPKISSNEARKHSNITAKKSNKKVAQDFPNKVYEMKEILQKRTLKGKVEYFISWENYGPEQNSWEPEANILCPVMLKEFEEKYLGK